jgi:hypothetical protein
VSHLLWPATGGKFLECFFVLFQKGAKGAKEILGHFVLFKKGASYTHF